MNPSMATIAQKAGVHKMTVSRAINGHPRVSPETRERILRIAKELGYQKNKLVSNVMSKVALSHHSAHSVPLVFLSDAGSAQEEQENPTLQRLIHAATARAEHHGFRLEVMRYRDGRFNHGRLNQILETRGIEGVLVNVGHVNPLELRLNWERLAVVASGAGFPEHAKFNRVQSDIYAMMKTAIEQLQSRGYQRIGLILNADGYPDYHDISKSVYLLYQDSVSRSRRLNILERGWNLREAEFKTWIDRERPDGIISYQENPLKWLKGMGVDVPGKVGFAMVTLSREAMVRKVSGIHFDKGLLARNGVDILLKLLLSSNYGIQDNPFRQLIPGVWCEGSTLRPPA